MTDVYIILDASGRVTDSFDSFEAAFKRCTEITGDDFFEGCLDHGVLCFTIMKVRKRPFKILREVKVTIHDEIKRKEVKRHGGTEDHSCDNLFKEW